MTSSIPFPKNKQLCSELSIVKTPRRTLARRVTSVHSSVSTTVDLDWLPGQPWIKLQDQEKVTRYLKKELITEDLNKLSPHLWLVATQNSTHISSLARQLVRGRDIVVTEDPGLHLTWIYERSIYLVSPESPIAPTDIDALLKAARGFLRSYAFLIQHKADYLIATHDDRLGLVPRSITFPDLVEFLRYFRDIPDQQVSPRY
ncbi:hypothetical protein A1O3_00945 [Capronia epimyces CBS 606.96]|uniref:Uncharacterized protein n=1 Tax=Capronia epimyces CBS 606.96 TaxID=1182542 RepID=W9YRY3_9EURO|nr:uncharacterized protein A1O3_00945 [Capronia epimyces CBS 606.96]EXJ92395.1 hypothetical protein A1O3_00945 [Capronia epimyces CBS 606.96]